MKANKLVQIFKNTSSYNGRVAVWLGLEILFVVSCDVFNFGISVLISSAIWKLFTRFKPGF